MKAKHGRGSKATSRRSHRASSAQSDGPPSTNAIQLLKRDHAEVRELFDRFERLGEKGSRDEKEDIVRDACTKLTVHATVEEEIFYPAAREAPEADAPLN